MPGNIKKLISEAFIHMVEKKDIDKITVKDIVEACSISRQTFYYHFQDIIRVIEWTMEQSLQETLSRSLGKDTLEEALEVFLNLAVERNDIIQKLLKSQRYEYVEGIFVSGLQEYLGQLFREHAHEASVNLDDLEIIRCFYTYGTVGVLLKYSGQDKVDTSRIARQLVRLLRGYRSDIN